MPYANNKGPDQPACHQPMHPIAPDKAFFQLKSTIKALLMSPTTYVFVIPLLLWSYGTLV